MVTKIQIILRFSLMLAIFPWCSGDDDDVQPCYKIIEGNKNAMDLVTVSPIQNIFEKGYLSFGYF